MVYANLQSSDVNRSMRFLSDGFARTFYGAIVSMYEYLAMSYTGVGFFISRRGNTCSVTCKVLNHMTSV